MAQTLDQFVAEMRKDLEDFETSYRKLHEEAPETYPLAMQDGNEGLWLEFLLGHVTGATED